MVLVGGGGGAHQVDGGKVLLVADVEGQTAVGGEGAVGVVGEQVYLGAGSGVVGGMCRGGGREGGVAPPVVAL